MEEPPPVVSHVWSGLDRANHDGAQGLDWTWGMEQAQSAQHTHLGTAFYLFPFL